MYFEEELLHHQVSCRSESSKYKLGRIPHFVQPCASSLDGRGTIVFLERLWAANFGNLHDRAGKFGMGGSVYGVRIYLCSDPPSPDNPFANKVLIKIRVLFMSHI